MADLTNTGRAPAASPQAIAHAAHGHAAGREPRAHQFDTAEQQFATSIFGMWVFLATEVLTFGGFFLAYIVYRTMYPEVFVEASTHQNVAIGAINTAVLIFSSLTMALAVWASQTGKQRLLLVSLGITMVCAFIFLIFKSVEYTEHFHHHLFPGQGFRFEEHPEMTGPAQLFFLLYFAMTGLHGLHVLIGIFLIGYLMIQTLRKQFSPEYFTPVEVTGLYWHFVDLVWIFLFPLLYLIGGFDGF